MGQHTTQASGTATADDPEHTARMNGSDYTTRDDHLLDWIGEQYCVRYDVVGWLAGAFGSVGAGPVVPVGESGVHRLVGRWRRAGWVVSSGHGLWRGFVWLSKAEARRRGWSYWRLGSRSRLEHVHAVAVARLVMELRRAGARERWVPERKLWGERSKGDGRVPDGEWVLPGGVDDEGVRDPAKVWAVEVELARKERRRVVEAMVSLRRQGYAGQAWFCGPVSRARVDAAKVEAFGSSRGVQVFDLPDVVAVGEWVEARKRDKGGA